MVDNWVRHSLSVLNTLSEVPKWCSQQFFFTLSWLISYPKLVHAAKSVTKTHVRGKRRSTPQLHTPVQRVYKQHPAGFRANKMGPCERKAGGRTRWLTGRVGVSSSRQASASSSPATVRALFWSTVPHMRMHMAEDAHTNTHTHKCKWGWTHTWADAETFTCPLYLGTYTRTQTHSYHYAPAVKSQLNNEPPALFLFAYRPRSWLLPVWNNMSACSSSSCSTASPGIVSSASRKFHTCLPILVQSDILHFRLYFTVAWI